MSNNINLHKNDLPDDLNLGNIIAVDGEFMGLNVRRDPLCLIQISSGNSDAHIIQFDRTNYKSPNLVKIINDEKDIILKQMNNVPDDKKDQIIQGKLNKFLKENTLLGQALITDPKKSVDSFLNEISKNNNISLNIASMDLYTI